MSHKPIILLLVPLLAGCVNQSSIQAKYGESKNQCREQAGRLFAGGDGFGNSSDAQAAVNNSFTDCMIKAGWRSPKPQQVAQTQNPPTGSPSTNPSAAVTRQRPPENPQSGAQVQPAPVVQTPPQVAQAPNPPSGAPSVNPSAAAAKQVSAPTTAAPSAPTAAARPVSAATTAAESVLPSQRPARPSSVPAPAYGSAARKF